MLFDNFTLTLVSSLREFFKTRYYEVYHQVSPGVRVCVKRTWWQRLMYDTQFSEVGEKHVPFPPNRQDVILMNIDPENSQAGDENAADDTQPETTPESPNIEIVPRDVFRQDAIDIYGEEGVDWKYEADTTADYDAIINGEDQSGAGAEPTPADVDAVEDLPPEYEIGAGETTCEEVVMPEENDGIEAEEEGNEVSELPTVPNDETPLDDEFPPVLSGDIEEPALDVEAPVTDAEETQPVFEDAPALEETPDVIPPAVVDDSEPVFDDTPVIDVDDSFQPVVTDDLTPVDVVDEDAPPAETQEEPAPVLDDAEPVVDDSTAPFPPDDEFPTYPPEEPIGEEIPVAETPADPGPDVEPLPETPSESVDEPGTTVDDPELVQGDTDTEVPAESEAPVADTGGIADESGSDVEQPVETTDGDETPAADSESEETPPAATEWPASTHWRLHIMENATGSGLTSIQKLELRGTLGGDDLTSTNGGLPFASGDFFGENGSGAFSGTSEDPGHGWTGEPQVLPCFVGWGFDEPTVVAEFAITALNISNGGDPRSFALMYLKNNEWVVSRYFGGVDDWAAGETRVFETGFAYEPPYYEPADPTFPIEPVEPPVEETPIEPPAEQPLDPVVPVDPPEEAAEAQEPTAPEETVETPVDSELPVVEETPVVETPVDSEEPVVEDENGVTEVPAVEEPATPPVDDGLIRSTQWRLLISETQNPDAILTGIQQLGMWDAAGAELTGEGKGQSFASSDFFEENGAAAFASTRENPTHGWTAQPIPRPVWIGWEFNEPVNVDAFYILAHRVADDRDPKAFSLQYLQDGEWVVARDFESVSEWQRWEARVYRTHGTALPPVYIPPPEEEEPVDPVDPPVDPIDPVDPPTDPVDPPTDPVDPVDPPEDDDDTPAERVEDAIEALRLALDADEEFAWGWHAKLAMAAYEEGVDHRTANRIAARFLEVQFGCDTTNHPSYPSGS